MPADVKFKYRTNTKREGTNGGHLSNTDVPLASREGLPAATNNAIYKYLRLFGLHMHVGSLGKESKREAMYCHVLPGAE